METIDGVCGHEKSLCEASDCGSVKESESVILSDCGADDVCDRLHDYGVDHRGKVGADSEDFDHEATANAGYGAVDVLGDPVNETSSEIERGSAYYCDDHLVVCRLLLGHR